MPNLLSIDGRRETIDTPDGEIDAVFRLFMNGDVKFLMSVLGHGGSNTAYPCVVCVEPKVPDVTMWKPFDTEALMRMGQFDRTICIYRPPLLPIPSSSIIVPCLHVLLGLAGKAHEILKAKLRQQITGEATKECEDEDLIDHLAETETELRSNDVLLRSITRAREIRMSMANDHPKRTSTWCSATLCLKSSQRSRGIPAELSPWEYKEAARRDFGDEFECSHCKADQTFDSEEMLRDTVDSECRRLIDVRAQLHSKMDTLTKEIKELCEAAIRDLHTMESDMGISQTTYYSCLIGRDIRKLAENAKILWGILEHDQTRLIGCELFETIYRIQEELYRAQGARDYSSTACSALADRLQSLTLEMKRHLLFCALDPTVSVTPKMLLLVHAVQSLRESPLLLLHQDSTIESAHQEFNGLKRRFATLTCMEAKLRAIAKCYSNKVAFYDAGL